MSLYVMGDIHGNIRAFDSIMNQISFGQDDHMIILGDIIDRHPGGIYLLHKIMGMKNVRMILGNHELMMLDAIGLPHISIINAAPKNENGEYDIPMLDWKTAENHWFENGGNVTKYELSYSFMESEVEEIMDYVYNLPLEITIKDPKNTDREIIFCHAAPSILCQHDFDDPEIVKAIRTLEFVTWDREWFKNQNMINDPRLKNKTVIFGHTPTAKQFIPNLIEENKISYLDDHFSVIDIDCGAGWPCRDDMGGRLGCLRLDDMQEFYSN